MKYIIVLGDGMADYPVPVLGNKTPLQVAKKPNMDYLAQRAEVGLVHTTAEGMPPGSDTTNLAVMGYDPKVYYSGRSSLEAVSIGIDLKSTDITFRANLVTLSDDMPYENKTMIDHSSDEISTEEADELIQFLGQTFNRDGFTLYTGVSYRHCLVWDHGKTGFTLIPPHDILEKKITQYIPAGDESKILYDMMKRSYELLPSHPVNKKRVEKGLRPANSLWIWGEAKKPALTTLYERFGKKGAVISAVDLVKGIGICAGLKNVAVKGATGTLNTNYEGKAKAALHELRNGMDFVYVHIEAPDECGHRYEVENKVKSIELIDEKVIGVMLKGLAEMKEDFCMAVLPDHPTPLTVRTHTRDPVPYILYRSNRAFHSKVPAYDEQNAKDTGIAIEKGYTLLQRMFEN